MHIAVAHILISALRELVVFSSGFREVCYGFIVVAVAILHHAIGIGSRADGFALACIDVGLEIFFGLLVVAGLVGTFANESVELVLKCRVITVGEQRFCKGRGLFEIALGEIYLADVVLCIIAEFAGAVHAIELLQSSIVAFGGIVEISLIEGICIAIALGALQHAYVHASLLIFAEAKQRVGAAVIYVLLSVGVESLDAHLVVVTHGFAVFSGKEQMVAYGSPCQVDIRRRWVCEDILLKGNAALALVALISAKCDVELCTFSHLGVDRHHLKLSQLVDGACVVFVVIHCHASRQVAFGRTALDVGFAGNRCHQA